MTHPDIFHKFSLHGHIMILDLAKKCDKFNILKARDIHKATTTESTFSNLTPSRSFVITPHLEMFLLPFVEVVILIFFAVNLP